MATFFPTDYTRSYLASRGPDGTLFADQLTFGRYIDTGSNASYAAELRDLYGSVLSERAGVPVTNYIPNPRMVNDTNSWTSSSSSGFVSTSYTRTNAWVPSVGGQSVRMQAVAPNDSTLRTLAWVQPITTSAVPTVPGAVWTFSFYFQIDTMGSANGMRPLFTWYNAAGGTISNSVGSASGTIGSEVRYTLTATAPALTAFVSVRTQFVNTTANATLDGYAGGWMLTPGSTIYPFFSGDTPQGVWNGTPNASTSYVLL